MDCRRIIYPIAAMSLFPLAANKYMRSIFQPSNALVINSFLSAFRRNTKPYLRESGIGSGDNSIVTVKNDLILKSQSRLNHRKNDFRFSSSLSSSKAPSSNSIETESLNDDDDDYDFRPTITKNDSAKLSPNQSTNDSAMALKLESRPCFPIYYNDVYEVNLPPGHRFPMEKYRQVREALQGNISALSNVDQSRVRCEFRVSPLAAVEQLITTHDADYIHRYLTGQMTDIENRNIGFPHSPSHVNRTLSSVGGTVAAACAAWEEYLHQYDQRCHLHKPQQQRADSHDHDLQQKLLIENMPLCWAAHVAGGTHHAFSDYGEGFCIFSDIAVAANVLLKYYSITSHPKYGGQDSKRYPSEQRQQIYRPSIRRILIIDLDVHQGNGNAALFNGREDVWTFSMHCRGNYFSKKETSDLDVELPVGCNDETYLSTLRHWLRRIEKHSFDDCDEEKNEINSYHKYKQFDFIFYQSGVDVLNEDRLGRLALTPAGVSRRNALVYDFAHRLRAPLVICMGGGYPKGADWSPILEAHTNVYWEAHQYLSSIESNRA